MTVSIERYQDTEIGALKSELQSLELLDGELTQEKVELEKLLSEFQHRHTIELGEIILELLKLRKIMFKDNKVRYEETENDERQYHEQVKVEKGKHIFELSEEQKVELKKQFRKATLLCHPDKLGEEFKTEAEAIFIELKTAYELNNLKKVTEILNNLERGGFKSTSETVSEKDFLIAAITKLRRQVDALRNEIEAIMQSETYNTIIEIDNWDEYFLQTKEELLQELKELKNEIKTAYNSGSKTSGREVVK